MAYSLNASVPTSDNRDNKLHRSVIYVSGDNNADNSDYDENE